MRHLPVYLCLLLLPFAAPAQKKDKAAEKAAATITTADLQKHLYIIAGREMEGRGTPSAGLDRAALYIESEFRRIGLTPGNNGSYQQRYPLYRDSVKGSTLQVNGHAYEYGKDYQPQPGTYGAELRFSEVVFAGYGISDEQLDDYKDLSVTGKLVLVAEGAPAGYKPSRTGMSNPSGLQGKMNAALSRGAIGLLLVSKGFPKKAGTLPSNWNPNTGYRQSQPIFTFQVSADVAAAVLGGEAGTLFERIENNKLDRKVYRSEVLMHYEKTTMVNYASNVVGLLEGTDKKDEYLVITAHYDHLGMRDTVIYYGADDDGSGTVGVMELAEAFALAKQAGKGPRRSIVFMTVSGEEKGLWGSGYYAANPLFPLDKTTANLNIDMIGRTDASRKTGDSLNYVYVVGDDKISSELKPVSEGVNKLYTKMELDYKFNDPKDPNRIYFRSDHYNFAAKGVPIIFYYDGMLGADYHRPTDTPDKINYPLLAKRAQLIFYTAWEMANRNEMMKRDLKLEIPGRN